MLMDATYRLEPREMNDDFFNKLKQSFFEKRVAIWVEEIQDTTEYLLASEANREHLLRGIDNLKHGRGVHAMTTDEMEAMIK